VLRCWWMREKERGQARSARPAGVSCIGSIVVMIFTRGVYGEVKGRYAEVNSG
jgi:hypothetical protein